MDERAEFIDRIRSERNKCSEEVRRLQERAIAMSAKARLSYEEQLADLQRGCSAVDRELNDLERDRSNWEGAKERVLAMMKELKTGIEKLRSRSGESG